MFSIPAPYATTAEERNQLRLSDLRQRAVSAKNNIDLAAEQLASFVEVLGMMNVTDVPVDRGFVYTTAEVAGRNFAEVDRLIARYRDLVLEAMVLASSLEVTA